MSSKTPDPAIPTKNPDKTLSPDGPYIHPDARVFNSTFGAWTEVGARSSVMETSMDDYSYVVQDSQIIYAKIGKFANIASHTRINPGNHPHWRASLHHFMYRSASYGLGEDDPNFFDWRREHQVTIGHDTWLGHGAIVMPGVTIGTGAIVGSGAIVTKDVPPYTIVVGNPATFLRRRVSEAVEEKLMRIAWWDWSHDDLRERMADFRALEAEAFAEKYDPEGLR
jgi:hypothetical protein